MRYRLIRIFLSNQEFKFLQSFVPCKGNFISSTRNVKRKDRHINNLFFCGDRNCTQPVVTLEELEDHMMEGIHEIPAVKSGIDLVKKIISQEND